MEKVKFEVVILGIIFDPQKRKILIGRKENDENIPDLTWCFPGGRLAINKDVDETLKEKIKLKTGYCIKNLGSIFSQTYPEKPDLIGVYFLTQAFEGQKKPGDDIVELKWVSPKELENYFTTSLHRKLKTFLTELVE